VKTLSLDIETYSGTDLARSGVYRYVEGADFEVMLVSYSADGGAVQTVDLTSGEPLPSEILSALTDSSVTKWAYNAAFERICLSRHLGLFCGEYLNPASWRCSMVWAAYMGLPLSLQGAGVVLGLGRQKLAEGKDLIRYFCSPCRPTAANGHRVRNLSGHAPDKWARFVEYNRRDVEAEMSIQTRLASFPVPEGIWEEYVLDQTINDCGVALDMTLVGNAIDADEKARTELMEKMRELTGLSNPNSVVQMKAWLAERGLEADSLDKKSVAALLKDAPKPLGGVLTLRQQIAKSSVRKYQAMKNAVCSDDRVRGMFQFYGANRTGRWAGRLVQLQNLPQNHLEDITVARDIVKRGDIDALDMLYGSVPETLSELIRTAFVPKDGCRLIVADFSAIEARVIAWLSGEIWRNEVFATHGKIYEASASRMFQVPIESVTKGSSLRQKGKIAELALGYGGSVGALKAMGALDMGLDESGLRPLVDAWRAANPGIVRLWWDADRAAISAVRGKTADATHDIHFECRSGMLFITLPSGRRLSYVKPRIGTNQFGSDCVTYEGVGQMKKWERIETYGPKLVENIVQAISRDILAKAMERLDILGCRIVMHVHDEVVIEAEPGLTVNDVCRTMCEPLPWAKGLVLKADSYECNFYRKD
jgi:DNA polymerase